MARMSAVAPATIGRVGPSWADVPVGVTAGIWSAAMDAASSASAASAARPSVAVAVAVVDTEPVDTELVDTEPVDTELVDTELVGAAVADDPAGSVSRPSTSVPIAR